MNKKELQSIEGATGGKQFQNVVFGEEAHQELLAGATILANAVRSTMGPSGHNVIIDIEGKAPLITKDGVTVARSINLKHKMQSIGAELLKEIAAKTNDMAGDGTTTATVLGHGLLAQGIKMIATGRSAIDIKKGMDLALVEAMNFLKENRVPVRDKQDIISVGTISANGDAAIGELLAQAIEKVGTDGIITVEPAKSVQTTLEIVEGMQFDGGFTSPYFVTNSDKLTCELENPYILITGRKISALGDVINVLEGVHKSGRPLVVIAEDVEGEALHTMIVNKMKGVMPICAVKAPSYGENKADILRDISAVTGGIVVDMGSEMQLKQIKVEHLGTCKKIIIGRSFTTIIGNKDEVKVKDTQARAESIRAALLSETLDELHVNWYRKRLAKLSGGIAVVKVGGATEIEILEKKDRVEDALNATMAASQEGIVPGGGVALFCTALHLKNLLGTKALQTLPEDVIAGIQVVVNACEMPLKTIVDNTGVSSDVVISKLIEKTDGIFVKKSTMITENNIPIEWANPLLKSKEIFKDVIGYDAANHKYTNLINSGIIDPVKVTRYALEHACSIVGLMLTCNAVIVND